MEQSKKKKLIINIIGVFILIVAVLGVTYAFFNYTRTGPANTVGTGRISFNSTQSGILTLTNSFPMTSNEALASENNTVSIRVYGDTTYSDGIEYLLTTEDVNIRTTTGKKVPLSIVASVTGNGLGTESTTGYFTTDRGHTTSYYKLLNEDVIEPGEYLLVGYIAPGQAGVDGTINITAYLDRDEIAISDTYDGTASDNMGTTSEWVDGRVVLTTSEWNSLTGNNALSFKVRVESNEGIWVGNPTSRNDMKSISGTTVFTSAQKSSITEIHFVKMPEERIDSHANVIDLTAENGQGVVKGWIEGTKLYIASPGETYFPQDSSMLLNNYTNVTRIEFNNVNTSNVTNMGGIFYGCNSLTNIDLSSFNTSSVTQMGGMFSGCSSLTGIDLSSFNTSSVTQMGAMFQNCTNLTTLNLSSFNTSSITYMGGMFQNCTSLQSVNLSGLGGNDLTNVGGMFQNCTNLREVNMSNFNFGTSSLSGFLYNNTSVQTINLSNANTSNVTDMSGMFRGCTSLTSLDLSNFNASSVIEMCDMFLNCSSLTTLDLSSFNTSSVTNMSAMFQNCTSLTTLDLSNFNASSVTNMSGMFQNCTSLTTLDLSNFNTSSVIYMSDMFAMGTQSGNTWTPSENALTTIIVGSGWNVNGVTNSANMFYNCTHLVGGAGSPFDSSIIDKTRAKVDGGQGNEGYLTLAS